MKSTTAVLTKEELVILRERFHVGMSMDEYIERLIYTSEQYELRSREVATLMDALLNENAKHAPDCERQTCACNMCFPCTCYLKVLDDDVLHDAVIDVIRRIRKRAFEDTLLAQHEIIDMQTGRRRRIIPVSAIEELVKNAKV
jgi:hypothetical protein